MKTSLRDYLDQRLAPLDWHGEDEVLRRLHPTRRLSPRAIAAMCIALLLLSSTALAMTLTFSRRTAVLQQAREAVCAEYGLTGEQLDLFSAQVENVDGGWRVVFSSSSLSPDALGIYTVLLLGDQTQVTWSHDGEAPDPDSGLDASAWGPEQIQLAMRLRSANLAGWVSTEQDGNVALSLEERAALDAPLLAYPQAASVIHVSPREQDLAPQTARELAQQAVTRKYGAASDSLTAGLESLVLYTDTEQRVYTLNVSDSGASYRVRLDAATGQTLTCAYAGGTEDFRLPEGDLSAYPEAAGEFVESGAFDLLPPVEKAAAARRYAEAGLSSLLPQSSYAAPGAGDIPEADAIAVAKAALADTFGMTEEGIGFYTLRTSLLWQDGIRVWEVRLLPGSLRDWHWEAAYGGLLGDYTVTLDASSAQVMRCIWSLQDTAGKETYNESNFGAAPAYTAAMLPWVRALLDDLESLLERYDPLANLEDMTLADRAAYDQRMRQAGYAVRLHGNVLPEEGELTQGEALRLAEDAIVSLYGLDRTQLGQCSVSISCVLRDDLRPEVVKCWSITFQQATSGDIYTLLLQAADGTIEGYWHESAASGNG